MQTRDFCFWLQGFFEISDCGPKKADSALSHREVEMIRDHLKLVFKHDPTIAQPKQEISQTPTTGVQTGLSQVMQQIQAGQSYGTTFQGAIC